MSESFSNWARKSIRSTEEVDAVNPFGEKDLPPIKTVTFSPSAVCSEDLPTVKMTHADMVRNHFASVRRTLPTLEEIEAEEAAEAESEGPVTPRQAMRLIRDDVDRIKRDSSIPPVLDVHYTDVGTAHSSAPSCEDDGEETDVDKTQNSADDNASADGREIRLHRGHLLVSWANGYTVTIFVKDIEAAHLLAVHVTYYAGHEPVSFHFKAAVGQCKDITLLVKSLRKINDSFGLNVYDVSTTLDVGAMPAVEAEVKLARGLGTAALELVLMARKRCDDKRNDSDEGDC